SSRRRHTRLVSDWSSDVCSSDLAAPILPKLGRRCGRPGAQTGKGGESFLLLREAPDIHRVSDDETSEAVPGHLDHGRALLVAVQIGRASCRERVECGGGVGCWWR